MNKYTLLCLLMLSALFSCHSKQATVYRAGDYRAVDTSNWRSIGHWVMTRIPCPGCPHGDTIWTLVGKCDSVAFDRYSNGDSLYRIFRNDTIFYCRSITGPYDTAPPRTAYLTVYMQREPAGYLIDDSAKTVAHDSGLYLPHTRPIHPSVGELIKRRGHFEYFSGREWVKLKKAQ